MIQIVEEGKASEVPDAYPYRHQSGHSVEELNADCVHKTVSQKALKIRQERAKAQITDFPIETISPEFYMRSSCEKLGIKAIQQSHGYAFVELQFSEVGAVD